MSAVSARDTALSYNTVGGTAPPGTDDASIAVGTPGNATVNIADND